MAQKNNIRSIRFSDEMAELIDQQVGDTFTQKFENLITKCVWELPMKEAELERIQQQIDKERKKLKKLSCEANELSEILTLMSRGIKNLGKEMENASISIS